ncbi:flagellar export chaperone FliS [Hydrogenimonas thermophila]|uniref:flagellar export chaperone FliS n=1 Tax=Hydrogenimonas thermophila TaxID=223786 RepID=UPI002936F5B4|nr:flagellar export chaperone FliS [Hydrogenimonas thermophila]WOE68924.1 flagellar export chaperone FliS [Hydrogenimonas thermophila]WOE71431.1 flagellar export chaperone FliS [Hydrogenimonas thermophila]
MTAARAYSTYSQNNVQIESPEKLIEMLYEGILRFCSQAKKAIENNDIEKRVYWINRAIAIFSELIVSLDPDRGGEIAYYLEGLYAQQIKFLNECNINNDVKSLEIVMNVTKELLEAWREEISHEMA